MFLACFVLLAATFGGIATTYFYDKSAPLIVRVAAGAVIGNALLGIVGFVLAAIMGLNAASIISAALIAALPALAFTNSAFRADLQRDCVAAISDGKGFLRNLQFSSAAIALLYVGLIVLLWFFFDRTMLEDAKGIGTGASNNIGDLPFHLLVINSFVQGQNFSIESPIYAGARFTYSFVADFVVAMQNAAGANVRSAMFWQNFVLINALIILFARFTYKLTNSRAAAIIAPFLLLFNGGLGFLLYFADAAASEAGVVNHIFALSNDYTIRGASVWRWGNALTILFATQRTLLLGLPLTLIVLTHLWQVFVGTSDDRRETKENNFSNASAQDDQTNRFTSLVARRSSLVAVFVAGLLAGMLPLVHAHSFAVAMGAAALLALMSWRQWREWTIFFAAAALVAIPELVLATTNSANAAESFIGWDFGWDNGETDVLWFWFVNTGLFIPLLLAAIAFLTVKRGTQNHAADKNQLFVFQPSKLFLFWLPFALCFIAANLVRLAPWVWDNIKVLIYWYAVSIPLVALLLTEIWRRAKPARILILGMLATLVFAGWLDVWRTASAQIEHVILPRQMIEIAALLRQQTAPQSLTLTAPEYANVPVLTGRRWFLGYTGHVWSHGIAPQERELIAKQIYAGGAEAKNLIAREKIDCVVVGAAERRFTAVNDAFFQTFPVIAEVGDLRVYRVGAAQ